MRPTLSSTPTIPTRPISAARFCFMLIALLIGEQLLAYAISYHPSAREMAR